MIVKKHWPGRKSEKSSVRTWSAKETSETGTPASETSETGPCSPETPERGTPASETCRSKLSLVWDFLQNFGLHQTSDSAVEFPGSTADGKQCILRFLNMFCTGLDEVLVGYLPSGRAAQRRAESDFPPRQNPRTPRCCRTARQPPPCPENQPWCDACLETKPQIW